MFGEIALYPSSELATGGFVGQINMGHTAYHLAIIPLWRGTKVYDNGIDAYNEAVTRMVRKLEKIFED